MRRLLFGASCPGNLGRVLPVGFLVLSLAIAGFSAWSAFQVERSFRATTASVLRDYGDIAAWNFEQRLEETLRPHLFLPFGHLSRESQVEVLRGTQPEHLRRFLDRSASVCTCSSSDPEDCGCVPSLVGRFAFFLPLSGAGEAPAWAGTPPDPSIRASILEAAEDLARTRWEKGWSAALLHARDETGGEWAVAISRLAVANCMPSDPLAGDTAVYGFEVDSEGLRFMLGSVLEKDALLPPTLARGRPNQEVIFVEMLSASGQLLFASHPSLSHTDPGEAAIAASFGGGKIRASVQPELAPQLIIGGLPENRTSLLTLTFLLACALAVAAVAQLRKENRLARLRQDFVASVSHELRTPLAQVRLFTETLRLGRVRNHAQRDWALGSIDRETQRLTYLVENILSFSRAERGQFSCAPEPVNLTTEVRGTVSGFQLIVPAKKTVFRCELQEGLMAEAHPDSVRQILLNLLDNAARYGRPGQTVGVSGERADNWIRIAVEDQGPGVPVAERESIFRPFHRGLNAVGTVAVGSGIGLSVVWELTKANGGRVWVEDADGGGAKFVVQFPALRTAEAERFEEAIRRSPEPERPTVADVA